MHRKEDKTNRKRRGRNTDFMRESKPATRNITNTSKPHLRMTPCQPSQPSSTIMLARSIRMQLKSSTHPGRNNWTSLPLQKKIPTNNHTLPKYTQVPKKLQKQLDKSSNSETLSQIPHPSQTKQRNINDCDSLNETSKKPSPEFCGPNSPRDKI